MLLGIPALVKIMLSKKRAAPPSTENVYRLPYTSKRKKIGPVEGVDLENVVSRLVAYVRII